jgi:hypothetical protein
VAEQFLDGLQVAAGVVKNVALLADRAKLEVVRVR